MFRTALLLPLMFNGAIFGFFYAWVCSTLWGLDTLDPRIAIQAMNAMNESVRNVVFFPVFFLTPLITVAVAVLCWLKSQRRTALFMAAAAVMYFGGAFVPTALFNVPMNRELALVASSVDMETARQIWTDYSGQWQFWNAFRTVASGIGLLLVGMGLLSAVQTKH